MLRTLHLHEQNPSSLPFEIQSMEWIDAHRHTHTETPHRHDYYVIIWFQEGAGWHEVDFQRFPLTANSFWFLSIGQAHRIQAEGVHRGHVISFTHDFMCFSDADRELLINTGLFNNFLNFRPYQAPTDQTQALSLLVEQMKAEYQADENLRTEALRSYLKLFLIQSARLFAAQMPGSHEGSRSVCLVRQFQELVDNQFKTKSKVSDYAERLNVTPNHLNDTVKRITGQPASEHIKQRVILEAKRRAYFGNTSAKEIAYDLGFDDEAHFSKYFKNNTGQTFSEYRKTL
ncbi:MAG: helix-turn-helix transcriptional regulator [Spirosomataceae bacterium]